MKAKSFLKLVYCFEHMGLSSGQTRNNIRWSQVAEKIFDLNFHFEAHLGDGIFRALQACLPM